ncbi:MAG: adenylate/guanylate cyclase domain-containing protein [Devosia sp.]|uniref:CHASE2 domain-containing protein n=1 Tax=Devosia sp. TaxID=1871048 RepID=UPI0024CB72A7|nr:adenylate/guanylate cyclase domain-containing protein [Devosia sp.]UYN99980.1 MAG: adenylate/guanylate cyclase domain-containing protein [Devosia sp.]
MGRRWTSLLFGLAVIMALGALRISDPYPVRVARETTFDLFQQIKPRDTPPQLPIRIIDIDEASLAELGQWPWPRDMLADLTTRLAELGAAAIVFDVLFSEADRLSPARFVDRGTDNDEIFAEALAGSPSVLSLARGVGGAPPDAGPKAGVAMTGEDPLRQVAEIGGAAQPLPDLSAAAQGVGVANLGRDSAGIARRLPLIWRQGERVYPALAIEALRVAQGASTLVVLGDTAGGGTVEQVRVGDLVVPTGPSGDIWLYYRELPEDLALPAREIFVDGYGQMADRIAGHIVLIGSSASGLLDIRVNTLGEAVAGVTIHAQALEQMLTGIFLQRADWVVGLELLIFAITAMIIVLAVVMTGPMSGLAVSLTAGIAIVVVSWVAFVGPRLLIDPSFSLFAALIVYAAMAFYRFAVTDADRRRIRRAFGHYVEPSLLTRIEADASLLRLGGDLRDLTVMFSDVRNFTTLAEKTPPAELVAKLNRLFAILGKSIVGHHGTIDKFMGDAVMAFWNAPAELDRHALMACRAALDMRRSLAELNASSNDPMTIGIGIATGPALVGNMGFEQRFDYSCIGDTVNVASRIEGACRRVGHDILVTQPTAQAAPEFAFLDLGSVELKGMSEPEPVLALVGDETMRASPPFARLLDAHAALLDLLSAGGTPSAEIEPALHNCAKLADATQPGLSAIYRAMPERLSDFSGQPVPQETDLVMRGGHNVV